MDLPLGKLSKLKLAYCYIHCVSHVKGTVGSAFWTSGTSHMCVIGEGLGVSHGLGLECIWPV